MSDDTVNAMSPILCWVMAPVGDESAGYQFIWSWTSWKLAGRIIAGRSIARTGSMGNASFQLLRIKRAESSRNGAISYGDEIIPGCYVCITTGAIGAVATNGALSEGAVLWSGWISEVSGNTVAGTTDFLGSMTALEMGHLFDRQQVTGWARKRLDQAYRETLNSPPTANMAGPAGLVIGNAVHATLDADPNHGGGATFTGYFFARKASECGTASGNYWTRWRLLRHLVYVCRPVGMPPITITCQDGSEAEDPAYNTTQIANYLNDTTAGTLEVFDLVEPTFKGQLDLLIPRALGLGWRLDVATAGWTIVIYTLSDSDTYDIPVNSSRADLDLTDEPITEVSIRKSAEDMPDEIVYEGGRIVFGGTVAMADANLAVGWAPGQLTTYLAGASGAAGYGALSTTNQKLRNRAVRNGPALRDVLTRFLVSNDNNGDVLISDTPGNGSVTKSLCPQLSINSNGTISSEPANSRVPYLPTATLLRTLPWPEGLKANGTDSRDDASKAQPQFLSPKVFRYNGSDTNQWLDLIAHNGASDFFPVQVDVDDRGPALRIICSPPEAIGKTHWTGAAIGDIDPDSHNKAIDYVQLVATIAIESDQRVRYAIRRTGVTSPRRTTVIRDERLQLWAVHKNTMLGLLETGQPDYVTSGACNDVASTLRITRNDWPLCVKRCKQAAAFAFRSRMAITISRARPDTFPTWAVVGRMIEDVIETAQADSADGSEVSYSSNTVIEEITREFGTNPRLIATTDLPSMPDFKTAFASSVAGGQVSVSRGGTVGQQASRTALVTDGLTRDAERVVVIPPKIILPPPGLWALLSNATLVDDNRWKYDWDEVEWTISGGILGYTLKPGGLNGPFTTDVGSTGWAWNSTEMDNTDIDAGSGWSDDILKLFDSFALEMDINIAAVNPIGTTQKGNEKFPIVRLHLEPIKDSTHVAYIFSGWNTPGMSAGGS